MRRSWLLARRNRDTRCPASATRSNCSYEIQLLQHGVAAYPLPANDDGNENGKKGDRERERKKGKKGVDRRQRLPAYLFVYRGNRGWFGMDKPMGREGPCAKGERKSGENGKKGVGARRV